MADVSKIKIPSGNAQEEYNFKDSTARSGLENKVDKVTGKGLSTNDYTTNEKNKLAGIATGAEVNQNAFSSVKVGITTVQADQKTDTLEIVAGDNVTLTPDATNDKITFAAKDTTYSNATQSTAGLMSSTDKTKLDGIATGAEVNVQSDWSQTTDSADDFIKNKPTLGTAAAKDVASTGNASATQIVMGNDTRLTDARTPTSHTHTKSQITDFPTLGTAAAKNVASSGNASSTQVVMGNDTRLSDSRPASDVSAWAKASTKPSYTASEVGAIATTAKGANNGVAELDSSGKVPSAQLPSFVDDVIEGYYYNSKFYKESTHTTEIIGESGKIYVDLSTDKTYRWGGSSYVVISETLALGETSTTAYRGDRGKTAYDHSQTTHARTDATAVASSTTNGNIKINGTETTVYTHPGSGTNPHGTTKTDIGLGNVGNFKAVSTVASQGLTNTEKSNARTNIGAGTSSLAIGTTSTTAAAGDHTHSTSIATSTGTNQATLAANTKYAITAGETSYIFTTPPDTTYTAGTGTTISGTNNAINVTYGTTANTACQGNDSRLSDARTPTSHTHGNIQNGGTLQTNDITIANGDKLVVTDNSDSSKIARTSISFDGSTTTLCLTKKGTWATFGTSNLALGESNTTAARGNHTHNTSIVEANDDVTNQLQMIHSKKYTITAGDTSFTFATPQASADIRVRQYLTTEDRNYPLLLSFLDSSTTNEYVDDTANRANNIYANPSSGTITSNKADTKAIVARSGTGTAGSTSGTTQTPSLWKFNAGITVANGEIYFIKIPVAGGTYGAWLSLNNGANYYPVAVSSGKSRFQTHYAANTVIAVTYESAGVCTCYPKAGGTATSDVTGIFRVLNDYDSGNTDTKVRQTLSTTNKNYPILLSYAESSSTTGNIDNISYRANTIYANPSTGNIQATKLNGVAIGSDPKFSDTTYTAGTGVTITGTNNAINVTYGTAANTACQGNDSRLSNKRQVVDNILTNQNLNTIVTPGFYSSGGGNTVTNKPSESNAFGMSVVHNAAGEYYTQLLYGTNNKSYRRYCSGNTSTSWTDWAEDKLTDRYVNEAQFTDNTSNNANSPVKMTLTRAGSDTSIITANIPKVSSSSAGVAPKGATVSSQSQSTKFLREDGTWTAPSYTADMSGNISDAFSSSTSYAVGDYCIYQNGLYKCTTAHSGTWSAGDFTSVNIMSEIKNASGGNPHRIVYIENQNGTATVTFPSVNTENVFYGEVRAIYQQLSQGLFAPFYNYDETSNTNISQYTSSMVGAINQVQVSSSNNAIVIGYSGILITRNKNTFTITSQVIYPVVVDIYAIFA